MGLSAAWVVGCLLAVTAQAPADRLLWKRAIPSYRGETTIPYLTQSGVFLVSERAVTAMDGADGKTFFQFQQPKGTPALDGRYGYFPRVVAPVGEGVMASRGDGEVMHWLKGAPPMFLWRSKAPGERLVWPLVAAAGRKSVVVDPRLDTAIGIGMDRREPLWEHELRAPCSDVVMTAEWTVLVTASEITVVSTDTGGVWFHAPLAPDFYALTVSGSRLVVVGREGHVGVVDVRPHGASFKWWKHESALAEMSPGGVGREVLVVASYGSPCVVGLRLEDGREVWRYREEGVVYWSAPTVEDQVVWVSDGQRVVALAEETGKLQASYLLTDNQEGGSPTWVPPVRVQGRRIVAIRGGTVFVFSR